MNQIKKLYNFICQGKKQVEYETALDFLNEVRLEMSYEQMTTAFAYSKALFV